jgi:hypothetical protein
MGDWTPVEIAAQAWHDANFGRDDGHRFTCWCCCTECIVTNPHYAGAEAAMIDDLRSGKDDN